MPRPYAIRMNINDERGFPCLMPQEGEKVVEGETLKIIEKMIAR
jgi:hypothetical protein